MNRDDVLQRRIRVLLVLCMGGLVLSGLTAFPLEAESRLLVRLLGGEESLDGGLGAWLVSVGDGIAETNRRHPFLAYGTDWLAFAHVIIAVAFIGPLRDAVRNVWVLTFGLIACAGVIPLALIAGPLREIPFLWRLIDCSFGVLGFLPLWFAREAALELERTETRAVD